MSRKRSRSTGRSRQRDSFNIARPRLLPQQPLIKVRTQSQLLAAARLNNQDRRLFDPLPPTLKRVAQPRTISGRAAQVVIQTPKQQPKLRKAIYQFSAPKRVTVCVRRAVRKEVIHALGHAGSKNVSRIRRRNSNSHISCK